MNIEDYIQRFQDGGSPLSADLPETPDARQARRSGLFAPKFQDGGSPMDPSNSLYITSDPEYSPAALSDMVRKEVKFDPSQYPVEDPSLAQVSMDRLKDMGQGFADIPGFVGNYLVRPDEQGDPSFVSSTDVMSDVVGLGRGMASAIAEDPLGSFLDVIPGVSNYRALDAANDLYDQASQLDKEGDQLGAAKTRSLASFSMTDVFNPIPGSGIAMKGIIAGKLAQKAPQKLRDNRLDSLETSPDTALEQELFREKGSFLGANGERKFEIDTSPAQVDMGEVSMMLAYSSNRNLGQILNFPELYENYPQLANVKIEPGFGNFTAQYYPIKNKIVFNPSELNPRDSVGFTSAILHEAQHAVQNIEDYLRPEIFRDNEISFEQYRGLPTEVEARNVQARFTDPTLKDLPPTYTTDLTAEQFTDVGALREQIKKQLADQQIYDSHLQKLSSYYNELVPLTPEQKKIYTEMKDMLEESKGLDEPPANIRNPSPEELLQETMERIRQKTINRKEVPQEVPRETFLPEDTRGDPFEPEADTRYRQNNPKR